MGDGVSTTFVFNPYDLAEIALDIGVLGNLAPPATSATILSVSNGWPDGQSATVDVNGNLTLTFVSAPPAATGEVRVQLFYNGTPLASQPPIVIVGGKDPNGNSQSLAVTTTGDAIVIPSDEANASYIRTFSASTGPNMVEITSRRPILSIQAGLLAGSPPGWGYNWGNDTWGSTNDNLLLRKMRVASNGSLAYFELILNGVLTGSSFVNVDPDSNVSFDIAATAITGGRIVDSGYLNVEGQDPDYLLHFGFAGSPATADIFTLVLTPMRTSRPIPVSGSFRWTEG